MLGSCCERNLRLHGFWKYLLYMQCMAIKVVVKTYTDEKELFLCLDPTEERSYLSNYDRKDADCSAAICDLRAEGHRW